MASIAVVEPVQLAGIAVSALDNIAVAVAHRGSTESAAVCIPELVSAVVAVDIAVVAVYKSCVTAAAGPPGLRLDEGHDMPVDLESMEEEVE